MAKIWFGCVKLYRNLVVIYFFLPINGLLRNHRHQLKYQLNTTGCKIPEYNLLFRDKPRKWDCGERLVTVNKVPGNKVQFTMKIPFQECCYMNLWFTDVIEREACKPFENGTIINLGEEYIYVNCTLANSTNYRDFYVLVKKQNVKMSVSSGFNVLILGLDSFSWKRANHALPLTVKYLLKNKWLHFKGYHKASTAANNIIPLLTGRSHYHFINTTRKCEKNVAACKDLLIWRDFERAGYVTATAEDSSFVNHGPWIYPTNHDITPFFKFIEHHTSRTICAGHRQTGLVMLDYILDLSNTYKSTKLFQFFWISSFVHGFKNPENSADNKLKEVLTKFEKSGVLNTTIVMILSDRGVKRKDVLKSKYYKTHSREVFYDNGLPIFFMWIPQSFQKKFSKEFTNLRKNTNKLTSVFDVYATLKNIARSNDKKKSKYVAKDCYTSKSLFENITEDRTCGEVCIPEEFCSCLSKKQEMNLLYSRARLIRVHVPKAIIPKKHVKSIIKVKRKPRRPFGAHTFREKMMKLEESIWLKKYGPTTESEKKRRLRKFKNQLAAFSTPYWFDNL